MNTGLKALAGLGFDVSFGRNYATINVGGKTFYLVEEEPLNKALSLDLYELSTCAAYLANGRESEIATFNMFYRQNPFEGAYTIFAGLEDVYNFLCSVEFTGNDIDRMKKTIKMPAVLWEYLRAFKFTGTLEAMPEGSMGQPQVPFIQITAPLPEHIIETQLLTMTGYATMVATRAARITSQLTEPWAEFSLRGCPGVEAGLITARSAHIGGASSTSNVLAHLKYGIPKSGTMPHSYIMSCDTQVKGFTSWFDVFRRESKIILDTYGYAQGMQDAVEACKIANLDTFEAGRDDSGDLAAHSRKIREYFDMNGLNKVKILASNSLNEKAIKSLKEQGARIDGYGVGRGVACAPDSGMVYKLVQLIKKDGTIKYAIKVSDNPKKVTDPGRKKVIRFIEDGMYAGDVTALHQEGIGDIEATDRDKTYVIKRFGNMTDCKNALIALIVDGEKNIAHYPDVHCIRDFAMDELHNKMWPEMRRLENPAKYFIGLSPGLNHLKNTMLNIHRIKK